MTINWNSIIEGASAGLAASVILGVAVVLRSSVREGLLRFRLTKSFKRLSCGSGLKGLTVGISNQVGRKFTVRHVALTTNKMSFRMNPTGEVASDFKGQHPKITRQQKRLLKEGKIDMIPMSTEVQHRSWHAQPTQEGFILVEPFTSHQFLLPAELITGIEDNVRGIQVTVEYTNWSGVIRIMKIEAKEMANQIQRTVDSLKAQIDSGSFDKARAAFRMPPVQRFPGPPKSARKSPALTEEAQQNNIQVTPDI